MGNKDTFFYNKFDTKAFSGALSGEAFLFGAITPFLASWKNIKADDVAANHAALEGKASFKNTIQQTNSKEEKTMKIIGSRFPLFFVLIMAVMMLLSVASAGADYTILHNFGASGDGYGPYSSPIVSGYTLYGTTVQGGSYDSGTLFKMDTDGTGYTILHDFGASGDGRVPYGSLLLSGSTLYGMTAFGGGNDSGTLFKMNTDGTGYTILAFLIVSPSVSSSGYEN